MATMSSSRTPRATTTPNTPRTLPSDSPQATDLEEVDKLTRPSTNSDPIGNLRLALNVLVKETEGILVGDEEGGYSIDDLMRGQGTFLWLRVPISRHPEAAKVLV